MSRTFTTVGALIEAAHRSRDGVMHGHTWTVWARFDWEDGHRDAIVLQKRLEGICSRWDHGELPDSLAWAEELAKGIASVLGDADYVRVERTARMLVAEWFA